jgi:hypothetical protein
MAVTVVKMVAPAAGALADAAVARRLSRPTDQRDLLVPHAFGVGRSINLARLAALVLSAPPVPAKQVTASGETG